MSLMKWDPFREFNTLADRVGKHFPKDWELLSPFGRSLEPAEFLFFLLPLFQPEGFDDLVAYCRRGIEQCIAFAANFSIRDLDAQPSPP